MDANRARSFTCYQVVEMLKTQGEEVGRNELKYLLSFTLESCYNIRWFGRGWGTGVAHYNIKEELRGIIGHIRFFEEEGGFFYSDELLFQYEETPIDYMDDFNRTC